MTHLLETATTGSRELSDQVLEALGFEKAWINYPQDPPNVKALVWIFPDGTRKELDPSRSLDDALALVLGDWSIQLIHTDGVQAVGGAPYKASIKPPSMHGWTDPPYPHDGYGASFPLALCIALLSAHKGGT